MEKLFSHDWEITCLKEKNGLYPRQKNPINKLNTKGEKDMSKINRKHHNKLVDYWSILHIVIPFMITWFLLQLGIEVSYVVFGMILVCFIFEPFEDKMLDMTIFRKFPRSRNPNDCADILFGVLGVLLALVCYLG